jgi:hypothetical protein
MDAEVERQKERELEREKEREQAILGVLRLMQPGSLAEAAQRASRQRCLVGEATAPGSCVRNAK